MVEDVQPRGIEIKALIDIADEGVVGPAVPQTGDDVEEFARAPLALGMLDMFLEAEIHRLVRIARGHDVPSSAATADVVE